LKQIPVMLVFFKRYFPVGLGWKAGDKIRRLIKSGPLRCLAMATAAAIIVLAGTNAGSAKKLVVIPYEGTLVLDPGHGGHDQGARGPDGTLEKAVSLALARRVAAGLNQNYRVVLTRTDDYGLDITSRTAIANHEKAKIFISLHTGGSFRHQATRMSVYYFEEIIDPSQDAVGEKLKPTESGEQAAPWDSVQRTHAAASRKLANFMQNQFNRHTLTTPCNLQGAPLMLLRGADMPAIIIEIGYLTNPIDEKMLKDPDSIENYAKIISSGINAYLEKTGP